MIGRIALLLALLASAVEADFRIGERTLVPAAVDQPVVASDGDRFLVADNRRVLLLSGDGNILRETPLTTLYEPNRAEWNGERYLVQFSLSSDAHRLAAFDRNGVPLGPHRPFPSSVWAVDGDGIVAAVRNTEGLHLVRLDFEGNVRSELQLVPAGQSAFNPTIAVTSAGTLVTWRNLISPYSHVLSRFLDRAGTLGLPRLLDDSSDASAPAVVATDGSRFLVVWTSTMFSPVTIRGRLLDARGEPESPVLTLSAPHSQGTMPPRLLWSGGFYRLVYSLPGFMRQWWDERSIAVDLSPSGTIASGEIDLGQRDGVLAVSRDRMLLTGTGSNARTVPAAAAIEELVTAPRRPVREVHSAPSVPAAVWAGHQFLVAWREPRADGMRLRVARLAADGTSLGVSELAVPASGTVRIASNGTTAVVLWEWVTGESASRLMATRIDANGTFLEKTGIGVTDLDRYPSYSIGSDGRDFLVVWSTENVRRIHGKRLSASGTVLDETPIRISGLSFADKVPVVVFDRTEYVVFWNQLYTLPVPFAVTFTAANYYCAPVSRDGVVGNSKRIAGDDRADYRRIAPAAAHDGLGNFLVAWFNAPTPARLFRRDRLVLPRDLPLAWPPGALDSFLPAVSWTGEEWVMNTAGGVAGIRHDGTARVLMADDPARDVHALASAGDGRALAVWTEGGELRGTILPEEP